MRLLVGAELSPIKGGIEARSQELRICSHGKNDGEALNALATSVRAWAIGLRAAGSDSLERAIKSRRLTWEPDGDDVEVEIERL